MAEGLSLTGPSGADATGPATAPPAEEPVRFGTDLLGTMREGAARLSLRPHFGDLINKDHFGVTARVRYGLADDWEVSARINAYVAHGLGDVPAFSKAGVSGVQVGTRHRLAEQTDGGFGLVVGIDYSHPVGRPPAEMADAYSHLMPYAIVSRRLEAHPEWTVYLRTGLDFVSLEKPTVLDDEEETENSWTLSPGVNWERGDWSWTVETRFRSSAGLASRHEYQVALAPSVSWRLPAQWTPGRKGRWILGLGFAASYDGEETDLGARGSLRTDFTLRELLRRKPAR